MMQETMVNEGATASFIPCRNISFYISSALARTSSFPNVTQLLSPSGALNLDMSPYVEPNSKLCPAGEQIWYDLIVNIAHEAAKGREDAEANEKKTRKSQ